MGPRIMEMRRRIGMLLLRLELMDMDLVVLSYACDCRWSSSASTPQYASEPISDLESGGFQFKFGGG